MIKEFFCINVSSKDVGKLVHFYNKILEIPIVFEGYGDYDGVMLGFMKDAPTICIWDENKWGAYEGLANFVFKGDDLDNVFSELREKGLNIDPPKLMSWGGRELILSDPDGNKIMVLE